MSTITQVDLWYDTGYTDGCVEVPTTTSTLPTSSLSYDGPFNPSTSDMFSRLKLRIPYTTLMNCSYIAITLDMNNGLDRTFYGWIDKVNMLSDTEFNPLTEVLWHVDLWRTYISQVSLGSGMVKRRTLQSTDTVPPQDYPYIKIETSGSPVPLITDQSLWFIVFTYNYKYQSTTTPEGGEPVTATFVSSGIGYFPVSKTSPGTRQSVGSYTSPSLSEVIQGTWDELIGLDPDSIKGVFISPLSPTVSTYLFDSYKVTQPETAACGFYKANGSVFGGSGTLVSLPSPMTTDDIGTYYVTGFDGEIIGELPWGITVSQMYVRMIIESSASYLQFRCHGIDSHVTGTCYTIPLIPLEVSSNSWSSYVYSGARQADIDQRRTEAQKSRESTVVSTVTNSVTSGVSGAMMGALGGPIGAVGGAALGSISSAISGVIGAQADYTVNTKYNDRFQNIDDYRASHQTDGLIMSGGGFDAIGFGQVPSIIKASKDQYSVQQRANDISTYGVHVSEPRSSCQSLLTAGGPLQISNVVVKGSVPVEAKEYIRTRLNEGVRMI